ncbi:hypothetical protein CS063_10130 [Sporanaerobium hydrogeniformans]|uniref:Uncharacterized protein n=1 Tax=Sporanaerobium hydrogeniformans TaxID=3072179 RepID=A0AC61DD26_9FIRM|nr:sensor histidine kinase [Sporanaerobium hydrogeniformans]PHV70442.1 hypothetical protein CS063_10130 [Sporanaerobium hydrogeniformans]
MKYIKIPIKKLRDKFLLAMLILTLVPIVIQTNISVTTSRRIIEENYISTYNVSLNVSSQNLDLLLEPIINSGRTIIGNAQLQNILRERGIQKLSAKDMAYIEKEWVSIMAQNNYIDSVYFFTKHNQLVYRHKATDISGKLQNINIKDMKNLEWYKRAIDANGKEIFICQNIIANIIGDANNINKYVSCVKLVKDLEAPYSIRGVLVINLRKEILNGVFAGTSREEPSAHCIYDLSSNAFLIENAEGQVATIDKKIEAIKAYKEHKTYKNPTYVISSARNATTGWELYNIVERQWLESQSNAITLKSIGLAIVEFILITMAFILISRAISRPLEKLERVIAQCRKGNYSVEEDFDDSEIGEIGHQFLEVVNNNIRLKDDLMHTTIKQKEAELMALQEQINPHFLYNTLDLLYWKAEINEQREIADLTILLSNIFKLTLNKGELITEVKKEIEHITYYTKIQKMRYGKRLDIVIDIEESILSCKIIKLLLQPIVENAIQHGIEPKIGGGQVVIRGYREGEKLIFSISDNGVGIKDIEQLEEGYGFKNVKERIALYYGQNGNIEVTSEWNKGTCVRILLEKLRGGEG